MMEKPYRSIYFNDERKWKSNHRDDDILQVGIKKAIGYICDLPDRYPGREIKLLEKESSEKGKFVLIRK
jgi:hypothetical protein